MAQREGVLVISDKGFASKSFEKALAERKQRVSVPPTWARTPGM